MEMKKFLHKIKFDKWKGWIYLSPALVLLAIFTFWPMFNTLRLAFSNHYNGFKAVGGQAFEMGIANFSHVVSSGGPFLEALENTVILCFVTVPISTILALLIAVFLNSIKPLQRFYQTIFFLPYVTNSIAIGMVFSAMFNVVGKFSNPSSWGLMNTFLMSLGLDPVNFINQGSSHSANMGVTIIYIVWNALPFKILVLLGALQSVNKQYYEAAKIDSTPRWRVFTRITVPMLSPMLAYVIITGFIGGFKEYSSIVGIFGDDMRPVGSRESMMTMVGFIREVLPDGDYGYASAAALILFAIIFAVTMVNLYVSKKKTHF